MKNKNSHHAPTSDALIELLDSALVVANKDGCITRVNIAAETLFNQSRQYLIGSSVIDLISTAKLRDYYNDCLINNAHLTLREVQLATADQESLVDITLQCINAENSNQKSVLIELNTKTRISRFINENNRLERLQSFRLMMRGLAHEIKNPLGGIRGAAQLLSREISDPDSQQLTDILINEADRLTRLVDRVMGSREQLRLRQINIHEVLEHVVNVVSAEYQNTLKVERFYDPALPEISVDEEQLIQAVLNIVENGIQAQEGKSEVVIGLHTEFDRFVTINQHTYKRVLKIKIWDEGDGVDASVKDILFDPLITTRADGTGLGLSITQEILQRHSGNVAMEKHEGRTCFTIYLPYLDNQSAETSRQGGNYE